MKLRSEYISGRARWLKVCPPVLRGSLFLRFGVVSMLSVFIIVVYFTCASFDSTPAELVETSIEGSPNQGIASYGNTIEENKFFLSHDSVIALKPGDGLSELEDQRSNLQMDQGVDSDGDVDFSISETSVLEEEKPAVVKASVDKGVVTPNTTNTGRHGIAPVRCDPSKKVSELFHMGPIKFLPEFKNPCWREKLDIPIEDMYRNNGFAHYSPTYRKAFGRIKDRWQKEGGVPEYRLRCLPYFFLAGQPKCGSTDLYKKLVAHPDIVTPPIKESHWWGKNRYGWCLNYTASIPFQDYIDIYDEAAAQIETVVDNTADGTEAFHPVITGDASVSTLWSNDDWWKNNENCGQKAPKYTNAHHLHHLLPKAKIIVILRNPTDRLYSDFLFFHTSSKTQQVFHEEVSKAIDSLNECILDVGLRACVYNATIAAKARVRLRIGLYQVFLEEWLALFPREQLLVIRLEDYALRPLTTMKTVHKFLDLRMLSQEENEEVLEQPKMNTRRKSDRRLGGMLPETRELLDHFYRPFNEELVKLLGNEGFLWKDEDE